MKTLWTIVLGLFLFLVGCNNNSDDPLGNWVKENDFEGLARSSAVSFVIGDKAYVGLGYNSEDDNEYLTDFWSFSPASGQWTKLAPFPGKGRTDAVAFSVNGKGYVGTGFDGDYYLKDIWEYNPSTNTWTQKDDFLGGTRRYAVGFALKNYGYIGTGKDGDNLAARNDFFRFNPAAASGQQWEKVASIAGAKRTEATAFTYKDKAYVCTGVSNSLTQTDMYEYDPTANTWTKKIDLNDDSDWSIVRKNACSFVLDNKAYICLGENSSTLSTVWEYDFAKDTWTEKTKFEGSSRTKAVGFTVGDKAYIATGQTGSYYLDDVWQFKPFEEYNDED